MLTEPGFPDLAETAVAAETPPPTEPEPAPRPAAKSSLSQLTPEDEEALGRIAESIGGGTAGRISLRLRRFRRGEGWKSIRAIPLERWMFENGFDLEATVGEHYGDGYYQWEIRIGGRYFKAGAIDIETYGEFRGYDGEAPPPEPAAAPTDLSGLLGQMKSEILGELRQAPSPDIAGAVRSALEPVVRMLEMREKAPADTATPAVLSLMSQQNQTLLGLVSKALEAPKTRPETQTNPLEYLKSSASALSEIYKGARELAASAQQPPVIYEMEEDEFPSGSAVENGTEEPLQPPATGLVEKLSRVFSSATERFAENMVQLGEEKLTASLAGTRNGETPQAGPDTSRVAGPAAIPATLPAPPGNPPDGDDPDKLLEQLVRLIETCVEKKVSIREFETGVLGALPAGTTDSLKGYTAAELTGAGRLIGRPDLTSRLSVPAVQAYLGEIVSLINGGNAA